MDRQKELMFNNGYCEDDEIVYLTDDCYTEALIGITHDMRTVYDYDKMVTALMNNGYTDEEAVEHIDFNVIESLSQHGDKAPIIYYKLERW